MSKSKLEHLAPMLSVVVAPGHNCWRSVLTNTCATGVAKTPNKTISMLINVPCAVTAVPVAARKLIFFLLGAVNVSPWTEYL